MSTLQATVQSPCPGVQTLNDLGSNRWGGANGDFAYGAVVLNGAQGGHVLVVTDLTPGSSCFPSKSFDQDNPSTTDPTGSYGSGSANVIEL